jgi:Zn-finger nucleic acid-binding protein
VISHRSRSAKGLLLKCPHCDATLRVVDRRGVEVDICPECRGIWLERGELEKMVAIASRDDDDDDDERQRTRPNEEARGREGYRPDQRYEPRRRKRSSWLSEFFEFGE